MRNHTASLLALVVTAAAGCAADAPGPDDYTDPSDPTNPPEQPVPVTAEGKFAVQSTFDVATNAPGTVGTVVNYFINATCSTMNLVGSSGSSVALMK